jgi:photosystem II stability/assembly factor-like uncharacterized protein
MQFLKSMIFLFWILLSNMTILSTVDDIPVQKQNDATTWKILEHEYDDAIFQDVKFINSTHGWICADAGFSPSEGGFVLHTKDGGETWNVLLNSSEHLYFQLDIYRKNIWITGRNTIFNSDDLGVTWTQSMVGTENIVLAMVEFINRTHGWTATNDKLYRSINGGLNWEPVSGWYFNDTPRMMQYIPPSSLYAIGFSGIYHSSGFSGIWTKISDIGGNSISFVNPLIGWATGDSRLARTVDGESWQELTVPGNFPFYRLRSPYLSDVQFLDENHGWVVGDETPIMYTPDGGLNWYEQSISGNTGRIMAIDMINLTHGWAVGWNGEILKTTNGNELDARFINGFSDPIVLSIVGVVVIVSTGIIVAICLKHRHNKPSSVKVQNTTEIV